MWICYSLWVCRAQMSTCVTRIFNHDGVWQTIFAHPFFQYQRDTAHVGQNRNQRNFGGVCGQFRQVQRQTCTHNYCVDAAGTGLAHRRCIFGYSAHDINGQHAIAIGQRACRFDFAIQCNHVDAVDQFLVARTVCLRHQIWVMAAQIDAGNGPDCAEFCYGTRQSVRRDTNAHAALDDRQ